MGTAGSSMYFLENFGCLVGIEASLMWGGITSSPKRVVDDDVSSFHKPDILLLHGCTVDVARP